MTAVLTGVLVCLTLPLPAEVAVQARPETLRAAVAQVCMVWGFPCWLLCVSSWGASCPRLQRQPWLECNLVLCSPICPCPLLGLKLYR